MNEVKFYCSSACGQKIAAKEYQDWKEKLSQGWTKCEECVKFWTEYWIDVKGQEGQKWFAEEKNQRGFLKLVEPGQGKLCQDHREWEESGKQWYEETKNQAQKEWNNLSYTDRLRLVKRERPGDKSCEERAARPEIDALVLSQFVSKANHEKYNCPNCDLKNYPSQLPPGGNDSNLSIGSNENSFPADNSERRTPDQQSKEKSSVQSERSKWWGDNSGLIISGIMIISLVALAAILVVKRKINRNILSVKTKK
ncbi:MAG: hypothetical protein MRERV_8c020 [Mycoplasmataceae bacterium RV_VA103A]|nr:MAG: hypothetical protein MRERV_8c020 [Mycoplasmataceae bacterium RV_VA103A]